jgi:hypothetical protein
MAVRQQRDLVIAITNPGIGADVEPNGLYLRDDPRVQTWPQFFIDWPATADEIHAAVQALSYAAALNAQNREQAWAEAEARDREKLAKEAAAEAEEGAGVRARWSRYWSGGEPA